jgi:hypothetical protein
MIPNLATLVQYILNGSTSTWSWPNKIFSASDLSITLLDTSTPQNQYPFSFQSGNVFYSSALNVTATVSNVDVDTGSQVALTQGGSPYAGTSGWTLDLRSNVPETQLTSIKNQGSFAPELHEEALDRLTREVQDLRRLAYLFSVHGPDIEATAWPSVGTPYSRRNTNLGFDSNGNLAVSVNLASGTLSASAIGNLTFPILTGEIGAINTWYPYGHAWRYLTSAQITDAQNFTYSVLQDGNLQNWIDSCYALNVKGRLPGGGYLISTDLIMNHLDHTYYRGNALILEGDGAGDAFVAPGTTGVGNTVIRCATNTLTQCMLRMDQWLGTSTTSGCYQVRGIRFENTYNSGPAIHVIQFDNWSEMSQFEFCEIYQAGQGDGIRCLMLTKANIQFCNVLNRDWNTAGLGASRVGCGINVFDQYSAGKGVIHYNTVRGFKDAIIIGYGTYDLTMLICEKNECSVNYRGITVGAVNSKVQCNQNYFEGTELTCLIDHGRYTSVERNMLQNATWTLGIDASSNGGGCVYDGNEIGLSAALSGVTGMQVNGSATDPSTVTNNQFIWGSSGTGLSNVTGLLLAGSNAMIKHDGNMFNPNAGWSGASNCNAFVDSTTSTGGSSGSGAIGFGIGMDATTSFPVMDRGAISLWVNPTAITSISGGAFPLTRASDYTVSFSGATAITSFTNGNEGQEFILRFTNANGTITAGSGIKLAGSGNLTTIGANGANVKFRMRGNVAEELSRTLY